MNIKYIELKTGYNDDGPAWIGNVKESKSGKTVYFNDHAFQQCSSRGVTGIGGNYYDIDDVFPIERIHATLNEQSE